MGVVSHLAAFALGVGLTLGALAAWRWWRRLPSSFQP